MTNNDILIRLRYALDIKNTDMVEIFKLGGMKYTKEDVLNMLIKIKEDEEDIPENYIKCNNKMVEAFLNGLITFKRSLNNQNKVNRKSTTTGYRERKPK